MGCNASLLRTMEMAAAANQQLLLGAQVLQCIPAENNGIMTAAANQQMLLGAQWPCTNNGTTSGLLLGARIIGQSVGCC